MWIRSCSRGTILFRIFCFLRSTWSDWASLTSLQRGVKPLCCDTYLLHIHIPYHWDLLTRTSRPRGLIDCVCCNITLYPSVREICSRNEEYLYYRYGSRPRIAARALHALI
ncbi:unnamed protein product [Periconia digitata]|uniref:Secreted protein n=1 Tax=Periconia digitata TaxID=1303443 RepID=A0A9W4XEC5_9PLEO|nr:unnamed protein product [Periconia digitata]